MDKLDLPILAVAAPSLFFLFHFIPYLYDSHSIRKYPGPFIAKFSDIWLGLVAKHGHRSEIVYALHKKYGTLFLSLT